jgi:hypothetical protein
VLGFLTSACGTKRTILHAAGRSASGGVGLGCLCSAHFQTAGTETQLKFKWPYGMRPCCCVMLQFLICQKAATSLTVPANELVAQTLASRACQGRSACCGLLLFRNCVARRDWSDARLSQ